jgi:hypothetical protein
MPPSRGHRATVWSDTSLSILCRTVRQRTFSHDDVQQSDYVFTWNKDPGDTTPKELLVRHSRLREILKRGRFVRWVKLARYVYLSMAVSLGLKRGSLTGRNPSLVKRSVSDLM